jgi:hypothetical protein
MPRLADKVVRADDVARHLAVYQARVYQQDPRGAIYRGRGRDRTGRTITVWIRARPLYGAVKLEWYTGETCPCAL